MSSKSCPISLISVDENIARVNAFYVGLFFLLYLLNVSSVIIYFLILDFMIRLFANREYSPLFLLSRATKELLHLQTKRVDAAPKRLASFFGLIFLVTIAFFSLLGFSLIVYILSGILLTCIALEVLFAYCLGCEIYYLYQKIFV